jgi:hypothetical protein
LKSSGPPRRGGLLAAWAALVLSACGGRDGAPASAAGTWLLDRVAYARDLLPSAPPSDPAARERAVDEARRAAAAVEVRLVLEADGTFLAHHRFDGEEGRTRGTWQQDGALVRLTSTHTPAGPLPEPETVEARLVGGALRFERGVVPRPFVLRRE